jgi:protein-tyrosine-phosphatase
MPNILIVCTANICRSPMGQAILQKLVLERPDADQWKIESAGTWAMSGSSAAIYSKVVMEQMGLDINAHRSQAINLKMIQNFDLILTMEDEQKRWLKAQYRDFADRIYLLSEMIDQYRDIPDPIGGEMTDYQETAQLLEHILTQGFDRICQLALIDEEF